MSKAKELIRTTAVPFFQGGAGAVYLTLCCERVYVGVTAATTCRTCKQPPVCVTLRSVEALGSPDPALEALLARIEAVCAG